MCFRRRRALLNASRTWRCWPRPLRLELQRNLGVCGEDDTEETPLFFIEKSPLQLFFVNVMGVYSVCPSSHKENKWFYYPTSSGYLCFFSVLVILTYSVIYFILFLKVCQWRLSHRSWWLEKHGRPLSALTHLTFGLITGQICCLWPYLRWQIRAAPPPWSSHRCCTLILRLLKQKPRKLLVKQLRIRCFSVMTGLGGKTSEITRQWRWRGAVVDRWDNGWRVNLSKVNAATGYKKQ